MLIFYVCNVETCVKSAIDVSIITIFFCIVLWLAQNKDHANTSETISFRPVVVLHALYNVQLSGKHEKLLQEICWNYAYLVIDFGYQYVGNFHNKAKHISSVVMHVGMDDMHTLLPWTCQMLFDKYDDHEVVQIFYMSQISNQPFHQTFTFVHFGFDLLFSSNNNPAMIRTMNV